MENRRKKKKLNAGIKVPRYMEIVSNKENKIASLILVVSDMFRYRKFSIKNLSIFSFLVNLWQMTLLSL